MTTARNEAKSPSRMGTKVLFYSILLTLQYGAQPLISKRCIGSLDSLTFSILNQTKIFFTALFTSIILRQKQSIQQKGALCLLIMAAILLSVGEGSSDKSSLSGSNPEQVLFYGIISVLVAYVLSGWTALTWGFVIVSALLVTALLQFAFEGNPPSPYCLVALPLVMTSISLYQKYSYLDKQKKKV